MVTQVHGCSSPFYKVVYGVCIIIRGEKEEREKEGKGALFGAPRQDGESGNTSWRRSHLRSVLMISRHLSGEFGNG